MDKGAQVCFLTSTNMQAGPVRKRPQRGAAAEEPDVYVEMAGPYRQQEQPTKRGKRCCDGNALQVATLVPVWIIALGLVVVLASLFGPYGKVNQMMTTADIMLTQVNNSGITDVIYQFGTNWQATNQTQNLLSMLNGANVASNTLFAIVDAIEPELVGDLMNKTSITVSNLLELIDGIINQKGLNINIPLGGLANMARRRLL